ncbi:MAG: hotdog fold thioesterase [Desulfitobacteriaceae bacterium]|nr:hotdog fold thioesterase [Desulfitobacteriaceae bacterium]
MEKKIISFFENDRFAKSVGVKLIKVAPGYAKAQLNITKEHLNAVNIVQGGATFTLADLAFAAAANSHGQMSVGISANITYFKPPQGEVLTAEAKEVSANNRLASYNVDIFDEHQDLIARYNGTAYRKNDRLPIY